MNQKPILIKSGLQRSAVYALLYGALGAFIGILPQVVGVFTFAPPWDALVPIILAMVLQILKIVQEQLNYPSVQASQLDGLTVVDDHGKTAKLVLTRVDGSVVSFTSEGKVERR